MLVAMNTGGLADGDRRIRAAGIDEMNVIAPADGFEETRQIALLIFRQNNDGNAHPAKLETGTLELSRIALGV
jgi:hypothetical protein